MFVFVTALNFTGSVGRTLNTRLAPRVQTSSLDPGRLTHEETYMIPILLQRLFKQCVLRGLTGGFLLLRNFSVTISVSPHVVLS